MLVRTLKRLGRAVRRYRVTGLFGAAPGPIVERFFGGKECFFVHIGSNDGMTGDPLYALIKANPLWRGIFVEPQPEFFLRLVTNYGQNNRFVFEQIAISDTCGEQTFYSVSNGIHFGSLNREHVLGHLSMARGLTQDMLTETKVRCEPLMAVLKRHGVDRVDVLQVDAESLDYQIIKQLDFNRVRPKLILYEHANLGAQAEQAEHFLRQKGYRLINCGRLDTLAVSL